MNIHSLRIAYFDCFSGIAGDMTLGALVDAGLEISDLKNALRTLPLEGWDIHSETVLRSGLRGTDLRISYLGREEQPAVSGGGDGHHHRHESSGARHHGHRAYTDIVKIIQSGNLPDVVRRRALLAFRTLAEAEGRIHGLPVEEVQFHELGAVDSILDIVGVAYGLWKLGIEAVESAPPPLGRGFVMCEHGRMPLPAPVTLEILTGVVVRPDPLDRELVTPTGAAFIKAWSRAVGPVPHMTIDAVGFGFGNAQFPDRPNALRILIGRESESSSRLWVLESNLDDLHPELAGYFLSRVLDIGALDAWFTPIQMKKNRPAVTVSALVEFSILKDVENLFLTESSSLGVRRYPVERNHLERRIEVVETPFGDVAVKVASAGERVLNVAPEHDACAALARAANVPLKLVYQHAVSSYFNRRETGE